MIYHTTFYVRWDAYYTYIVHENKNTPGTGFILGLERVVCTTRNELFTYLHHSLETAAAQAIHRQSWRFHRCAYFEGHMSRQVARVRTEQGQTNTHKTQDVYTHKRHKTRDTHDVWYGTRDTRYGTRHEIRVRRVRENAKGYEGCRFAQYCCGRWARIGCSTQQLF